MVSPDAGSHEFLLPTGGVRQTSTPATVLSQKQYKKEEERIIRELQLATQERNELRDRLIYITEGSMNKRYALLQTLWCQSWACTVTLILLSWWDLVSCASRMSLCSTSFFQNTSHGGGRTCRLVRSEKGNTFFCFLHLKNCTCGLSKEFRVEAVKSGVPVCIWKVLTGGGSVRI